MFHFDWVLDQRKFLSASEAKRLLATTGHQAEVATYQGRKVAVRDYFIIHLALATGLRVMEIANLHCSDVFIDGRGGVTFIRKGKGGKKRLVHFNKSFQKHFQEYLNWKGITGEPTGEEDPLLYSSNTGSHMTTRAIEKVFKRAAKRAGLSPHYAIHSLRHTYACELYRASGYNLRLVQKQLGHSSSRITEVYADVINPDLTKSLEKLYL